MTSIDIAGALRYGWLTFKENAAFLVGVVLAASFLNAVVSLALDIAPDEFLPQAVLYIINAIVSILLEIGLIQIALKFVDGEQPEFSNLFDRLALVPQFFLFRLLAALLILVGFAALIVPGIYLLARLCLVGPLMVDERATPSASIEESWRHTRGHVMELVVFGLVIAGLNLLGGFALLVGMLVTIPVSLVAIAHVYRQLCPIEGQEVPHFGIAANAEYDYDSDHSSTPPQDDSTAS